MENMTSREGLGQDPVASDEEISRVHARNDWQIAADRALADIRRRSREGKLTTPDRWVKRAFAPEGVDPRVFAGELLAYVEERPHAEDTPAMGKQELPLGYDDRPELDELDLDDPLPEPEVTDIVLLYGRSGTYMYSPRVFAGELLAYVEERPHAEDTPAMGKQELPLGYDDRPELAELDLDDPLPEPEVTDIVLLYGRSGTYMYSKPLMSHSYAHALFNTAEGDDLATFADVVRTESNAHALFNTAEGDDLATFADAVRTESRVYPRPVAASDFLNQPYLWPASMVVSLYEAASRDEAYADIEIPQTSLIESYFYSTRHLSPAQAKALAEWYGVEKFRNP